MGVIKLVQEPLYQSLEGAAEGRLTLSEMPIKCKPGAVNISLTRVRLLTFSERIHSARQFKLQENTGYEGSDE